MQTAVSIAIATRRLGPASELEEVVSRVCSKIAPTWPLDLFIAVNPFWGMVERQLPDVSAEIGALSGSRLVMPRSWFRQQWHAGRLDTDDLRTAMERAGEPWTARDARALLEGEDGAVAPWQRVMDLLDGARDLSRAMPWRDFVTTSTSQLCASYFDDGQASFGPDHSGGLYATFRRYALVDASPRLLMGLREYEKLAHELPQTALEMVDLGLRELDVPEEHREAYLTALLLDLNGWAAWCAYRAWTSPAGSTKDDSLTDLLGVRVAWEWMLFRSAGAHVRKRWTQSMGGFASKASAVQRAQSVSWILQDAIEIAWQRRVAAGLTTGAGVGAPLEPAVQAVFCIDVRSEVFRRALESESPSIQTAGFAGFFGLPADHVPLGSTAARPHLPGLLSPRLRVTDSGGTPQLATTRASRLAGRDAWKGAATSPISAFQFVEAFGLSYAARLVHDALGLGNGESGEGAGLTAKERALLKPRLAGTADGHDLQSHERAELAAGILRAMSLTKGLARIVLLVGHGSSVRNNPHRAGLDCGACCGNTGEVSARATAALLNDGAVRRGLVERGITVPDTTRFVAALHDTTTDEVKLFDLDDLPASHASDVEKLREWLRGAGAKARAERASALGLGARHAEDLHEAVLRRSRDWAEVRPEWGLAGNAGFIVAPRERTRHLDLGGRVFLHDYRHEDDVGFATLELIMTAPMIVTHWINFQYYASTVANQKYGSGNKVLHNVVGGHVGVFEGNGGDLRIGLPLQSLHDGSRWVHQPLRLSVFIDAPRFAIDAVLLKHEKVRQLVDNGWLHLFQLETASGSIVQRREGGWGPVQREQLS